MARAAGRRPLRRGSRGPRRSARSRRGRRRHQSAASSKRARLPRVAAQNGSASGPAIAERLQPFAHGGEGQVMQHARRQRPEFGFVETRRGARNVGEVERFGEFGERGDRPAPLRPSRPAPPAPRPRAPRRRSRAASGSTARRCASTGPRRSASVSRLWWPKAGAGAAKRLEDLDLHRGVGDVVFAADDMGDAEVDVVDHRGQRVEVAAVLARQHRIGERGAIDMARRRAPRRPSAPRSRRA